MSNPVSNNPNAAVAGGTVGGGVLVVWALGHFGVSLTAEEGGLIAGYAGVIALFVGRNGIKGTWDRIWEGSRS